MRIVKRLLLAVGVLLLLVAAAAAALLAFFSYRSSHYYRFVKTGGPIEARYMDLGPHMVAYAEFDAPDDTCKRFEVWYPAELTEPCPLVVMANGTGVPASQYKAVFRHLASWGFIVVGNEDASSRSGGSSAASLDFMLAQSEDPESVLFGRVDAGRVGVAGHSQGGVGAVNAATAQPNSNCYKAIFTASATSSFWGQEGALGRDWRYDVSKLDIPYLMVAGTGAWDAGTAADRTDAEGQGICPLWSLQENYAALSGTAARVMARRTGTDHGDMLTSADGYMTAWFLYWLRDEVQAGEAFFGDAAEITRNANWQDVAKSQ